MCIFLANKSEFVLQQFKLYMAAMNMYAISPSVELVADVDLLLDKNTTEWLLANANFMWEKHY